MKETGSKLGRECVGEGEKGRKGEVSLRVHGPSDIAPGHSGGCNAEC